ncbi:S-adenosyl-L-methionine-dependent methyltransferase [Crassisporium funariophilum]|nr:S-adenosyl-L-methionine-dependent methyltransferase [Crassisporium funariophilum]
MSVFAKSTFNASTYSASRPRYPQQLFEYIFSFHRGGSKARWERAVDLGCGTGQATVELRPFQEVLGVDPSPGMLDKARAYTEGLGAHTETNIPAFKFVQGSAEDLSKAIPEAGSVDLLIAAQAAHWFDWKKVWPEVNRVLRPGGTAAFWVYTEIRLTDHPGLTPLITQFFQGQDPVTSIGPHFSRPGRTILERYLVDVPDPSKILKDGALEPLHRTFFCEGPPFKPENAEKHPIIMRSEMRWRDLLGYFRSASALHTYHEQFPEDLDAEEDKRLLGEDLIDSQDSGGDIAVRFWRDLRVGALEQTPGTQVRLEDKVVVEWPVALLLTRKL